jgi:hypothetical protein
MVMIGVYERRERKKKKIKERERNKRDEKEYARDSRVNVRILVTAK